MQPTISGEQFFLQNDIIFMQALTKIDPELVMIRNYLNYTKINPNIIPIILDQMALINKGGGNGKVVLNIQDGNVTDCEGISDRIVDMQLLVS